MITLSQASHDTKDILKWGGLFIAGLVIVVVFIQLFLIVKEAIFPTPPPKPTVAFGKLEAQVFPSNITNQKLSYKINTLTGSLPSYFDQVKIFKMKTYAPDLLGLKNAQAKVIGLGFTSSPIKISDSTYQWTTTDDSGLSKSIKMDIITYDFVLTSNFASTSLPGSLPDKNTAIKSASKFLSDISYPVNDIDNDKTQVNYFSLANGQLIPSSSVSNAQTVEVDLFQKDINKISIIYEGPKTSNLNVLIGNDGKILQSLGIHQTATEEFATYPVKTTKQAFDELQDGNGYVASYQGSGNVSITDVSVAYYIATKTQKYLMPVFVFQGNDNFYAYVPAVTDEWIDK